MMLINLKIMKIIVIRWIKYYFKGCKPARWLHRIGDAALLGEISATICVCRNPYIRFRGRWERRGSLLGVWAAARWRLSALAHLEEGGGIIKIFATIICSKQCCVVTIIAIIALLYHLLVQLLALLQKRIGLAFIEKRGQRHWWWSATTGVHPSVHTLSSLLFLSMPLTPA